MRKLMLLPILFWLLLACTTEKKLVTVAQGASCKVQAQVDGSSQLVCADGSRYTLSGLQATTCTVYQNPQNTQSHILECPDGSRVTISNGKDGRHGEDGVDGQNGKDGLGCNAKAVNGGVEIQCGNDAPILVKNGSDGQGCSIHPSREGAIIRCGGGLPVLIQHGQDAPRCAIGRNQHKVEIVCGEGPTIVLPTQETPAAERLCRVTSGIEGTLVDCGARVNLIKSGALEQACDVVVEPERDVWTCGPHSPVELFVES